jgi:molybdopterin converting factor small subunit
MRDISELPESLSQRTLVVDYDSVYDLVKESITELQAENAELTKHLESAEDSAKEVAYDCRDYRIANEKLQAQNAALVEAGRKVEIELSGEWKENDTQGDVVMRSWIEDMEDSPLLLAITDVLALLPPLPTTPEGKKHE